MRGTTLHYDFYRLTPGYAASLSEAELVGEFSFAESTPVRSKHRLSEVLETETLVPVIAVVR